MINTYIHYTPTIYPIYDIPIEELALTLNDKKRKIKKADFVTSMQASGLEDKVIENIFNKFAKAKEKWFEFIDLSFLPDEMKEAFKAIIAEKLSLLA
ncbi:MAG: HipA domain-containing protein [Rikenellaceae bacterium]|nr:HipA domain-containing protein [Rikenellaceae bacterium]